MPPRATQASQSQRNGRAGPSQSQGRRASRRDPDEDEEENEQEDYDEDEDEAEYGDDAQHASQAPKRKSKASGDAKKGKKSASAGNMSQEEIRKRAYDLVRMLLFEEPKRGAVKRADILKKVFPENSRASQIVFDTAQIILDRNFGMEMAELMTRAERDSLSEAKDEQGGKKKGTTSTSKSYILRSRLDPELVRKANTKIGELQQAEIQNMKDLGLVNDEEDFEPPRGSILGWSSSDSVELTGVLYILLCLILVNGRSINEPQLKAQLKSFHLHLTTRFTLPAVFGPKEISLEDYLDVLIKQNYLDRVRQESVVGGATQATQKGRRKSRMTDKQEDGVYEFKWGTRAHAEIGEESVAQFMADFSRDRYHDEQSRLLQADLDDEEPQEATSSRNRKKRNTSEKTREEKLAELEEKSDKYGARVLKDIRLSATHAAQPLTDIKWGPSEDNNADDAMEE